MSDYERKIVLEEDSKRPIVIRQSEFNDLKGIDVRRHFYNEENELIPTKKGIWLRAEQWDKVLIAIEDLIKDSNTCRK